MRAMTLEAAGQVLRPTELSTPAHGPGQVRVKVQACGLCRTTSRRLRRNWHAPNYPSSRPPDCRHCGRGAGDPAAGPDAARRRRTLLEPGAGGQGATRWASRGWLECGRCRTAERTGEPLRPGQVHRLRFGRGFANTRWSTGAFAFPFPDGYPALQAAPLLCAGLIATGRSPWPATPNAWASTDTGRRRK